MRHVIRNVRETQFGVVETIRQELQQVVEEMRMMVMKAMWV